MEAIASTMRNPGDKTNRPENMSGPLAHVTVVELAGTGPGPFACMLPAPGVLAAYAETRGSGRGQVVDAAMIDGSAILMAPLFGMMAKGFWKDARGANFLDGAAHVYGTYRCTDGQHVSIGAIEPQFYRLLLDRCGIADPHFDRQWECGEWDALKGKPADVIGRKTRDDWCLLLEGSDACFAPVLSMAEAATHPHNLARGMFVADGGVVQPAPAPRFDRTPAELPSKAPAIGEDTRMLLSEVGYSGSKIDALISHGAAYELRR